METHTGKSACTYVHTLYRNYSLEYPVIFKVEIDFFKSQYKERESTLLMNTNNH